jgi:hypothetical protein
MAGESVWRADDVVAFDLLVADVSLVIASILGRRDAGVIPWSSAAADAAELLREVRSIDPYDRRSIDEQRGRLRSRLESRPADG